MESITDVLFDYISNVDNFKIFCKNKFFLECLLQVVLDQDNIDSSFFEKIFKSNGSLAKELCAKNEKCPQDILHKLSKDRKFANYVAENKNTSNATLVELIKKTKTESIVYDCFNNKNLKSKDIENIYNHFKTKKSDMKIAVFEGIASSSKTPVKILKKLSEEKIECVHYALCKNWKIPTETIDILINKLNVYTCDKDSCLYYLLSAKNITTKQIRLIFSSFDDQQQAIHGFYDVENVPKDLENKLFLNEMIFDVLDMYEEEED